MYTTWARRGAALSGVGDALALAALLWTTWDALIYVAFRNRTMTLSDHHLSVLGDGINQAVAVVVAVVTPWLVLCAALTWLASLRKLPPMVAFGPRALDALLVGLLLSQVEQFVPALGVTLAVRWVLDLWGLAALGYLQATASPRSGWPGRPE